MSAPSHRGGTDYWGGHDRPLCYWDNDGIRHPVPVGHRVVRIFGYPWPRISGEWPRWRSPLNE
jgi:hypothetical protein